MQNSVKDVDISKIPELVRIAEAVRDTNQPRRLTRGGEVLAILVPFPSRPSRRSRQKRLVADHDPFLAAAGGWRGLLDADAFKEDIAAARGSDRSPVRL